MKYSVGIIGSGNMGRSHTYAYDRIHAFFPDVEIVKTVMCSRNIKEERITELGWNESETDWRKAVCRPDIDVVDISAYDSLHYPIAKEALLQGKHVICEKPLAGTTSEAEELLSLAHARGLVNAVCLNFRYMPAIRSIAKLIADGELGEIRHVHCAFTMDWAVGAESPMNWRQNDSLSPGGALGDLGTHLADLCCYLGLTFTEVCGLCEVYGKRRPSGDGFMETASNEICAFTARFSNGALGVFEVSRVSGCGGMSVELHGTRGNVRWEKNTLNDLYIGIPGRTGGTRAYERVSAFDILRLPYPWPEEFVQSDGFTLLFHDALTRSGAAPSFADGCRAAKIVDAVLRSAREKRTVPVE